MRIRVRRDIRAQQDDIPQPLLNAGIAEGESVHFQAGDAPLGPQVEHDRPSARILQPLLQLRRAAHRNERKLFAGQGVGGAQAGKRLQDSAVA